MSVNIIKNILLKDSNNLAFVLGNGINRFYKNDGISWEDLLLSLWRKFSKDKQTKIPEGIAFTEFYDALEIQNAGSENFSAILQKEVKQKMHAWQASKDQNLILEKIKKINCPILTTNFDDLIPKSMHLDFMKIVGSKFTDYYPWSSYYSNKPLEFPSQGFGVWYINGMIKYHRSIKLGLSQYMGNVERARQLISKKHKLLKMQLKLQKNWQGSKTWLQIIFEKSLVIFGLGLDENEVFLRWLLIERAKYYQRYPKKIRKGYYIDVTSKASEGKKFFLNSVGFEVIELDSYKEIYEDIWLL